MPFTVSSAKVTGNPDSAGWTQIHDFYPEEDVLQSLRGHLYTVITTSNTVSDLGNHVGGKAFADRLNQLYFSHSDKSPIALLREAVGTLCRESQLRGEQIEVVTLVSLGAKVYLSAANGAEAYLIRNNDLIPLFNTTDSTVVTISGVIKEGDGIILGTKTFFRRFPPEGLKKLLFSEQNEGFVETVMTMVRSQLHSGGVGMYYLQFESVVELESRSSSSPLFLRPKLPPRHFSASSISLQVKEKLSSIGTLFRKETGVDERITKRKKISAIVGIGLLLVLTISILVGVKQKNKNESRNLYLSRLADAQHSLSEAVNLSSIDKTQARELLIKSRDIADELSSEGVDDPDLTKLKEQISANEGSLLQEYRNSTELFVDLGLLSDGFTADSFVADGEKLYLLNKSGKRIISITIDTKYSEVVAGPGQIDEAENIAAYANRIFLLNRNGVYEVGSGKTKLFDSEWGAQSLVAAYAGNLYVLDKNSSTIWRYAGSDGTFSPGKGWLAPGITVDLTPAKQWVIDGMVWVITDNGKIVKLSNGIPQPFRVSGVFPEIANPTSIYTSEDLSELYVLDPDNSRVVVLTKEGEYVAQYHVEHADNYSGVVVSKADKKMVLIGKEKLYSVNLSHF